MKPRTHTHNYARRAAGLGGAPDLVCTVPACGFRIPAHLEPQALAAGARIDALPFEETRKQPAKRHDIPNLRTCPNTGQPFDGFAWTRSAPFDTCRACCERSDPMRHGLAANLRALEKARALKSRRTSNR